MISLQINLSSLLWSIARDGMLICGTNARIMLEGRRFAQFARPGPFPSIHTKLLLTVDDLAFLIKEFTVWVFCLAVKGIKKDDGLWMNTAELWEEDEKHQDHCFDLFFDQVGPFSYFSLIAFHLGWISPLFQIPKFKSQQLLLQRRNQDTDYELANRDT